MNTLKQQFDLAFAKHQAGEIGSAAQLYRAILEEDPQHCDALHMLGVLAQQKQNPQLALQLMDLALQNNKNPGMVFYNRSLVLRALGRIEEALCSVEQTTEFEPQFPDAWDMAGSLARLLGRFEEAKKYHKKAVSLQPGNVRFCSNLAVLLIALGDLKAAYGAVSESEKLGKDCRSFVLGNVLRLAGYPEKAIPHYQRVSQLDPSARDAGMNEAMAWLQIGNFERGFDLMRKWQNENERLKDIPLWQGEKTAHLLLYESQGIGDVLQMVRYIPLIKERVQKLTIEVHPELSALLKANFPEVDLSYSDGPLPNADKRVECLHLPAVFRTRLDTVPNTIPYLKAEQSWRAPWQEKLKPLKKPYLGFVWAGNPTHKNNHYRSLMLEQIAPLLKKFKTQSVSLQKWQIKDEPALLELGLLDADPYLNNFTDTAGLIMELDLVITVDTAVAHLAGALGKPVWVLVPFDPDWRWMQGREDSPWYKTIRLFRQTEPRNWTPILAQMGEELEKFTRGDEKVLKPQRWTDEPLRQNPLAFDLGATA